MYEFFISYGLMTIKLLMAIIAAVAFMRLFNGAIQLKQATTLDLIVNILLSAILSDFILDDRITMLDFLVIVLIYGVLLYGLNKLTSNTNLGRRIFIGNPRVIIQNGEFNVDMMSKLNISAHDLAVAMRHQQIKSLKDVEMAQIEPNGDLTIVKKGDKKYSVVIIDNGNIDKDALSKINRSEQWLRRELRKKHIKDIDDIFVAQWNNNRLQIVKRNQ